MIWGWGGTLARGSCPGWGGWGGCRAPMSCFGAGPPPPVTRVPTRREVHRVHAAPGWHLAEAAAGEGGLRAAGGGARVSRARLCSPHLAHLSRALIVVEPSSKQASGLSAQAPPASARRQGPRCRPPWPVPVSAPAPRAGALFHGGSAVRSHPRGLPVPASPKGLRSWGRCLALPLLRGRPGRRVIPRAIPNSLLGLGGGLVGTRCGAGVL